MKQNSEDLFAGPLLSKNARHIYTVSELTKDIKLTLDNTFTEVWVEGEISGISRIATGTVFFSLKDAASVLKCVIFPSFRGNSAFELKDGLNIICFGRISVYEKSGQYQLYVEKIEPKGLGSLQLALEQLKERLEKEGLFAAEHKKAIPYLPRRIGVVTSISGAAIKDILKVLDTRFKEAHIIINPVRVQGEGAKEDIAQAIKDLNSFNQQVPADERIEVMIVGRGGGSIEDLWAFNEEIVARAIYQSRIPVISAVGHERDWTIADMVADLRSPTPSAAAERVLPKKEDLEKNLEGLARDLKRSLLESTKRFQEEIDDLAHRLSVHMDHARELNTSRLETLAKKLALLNPKVMATQYSQRLADYAKQMQVRMHHYLMLKETKFSGLAEKFSALNPLNILYRGYSATFTFPDGEVIKDSSTLKAGNLIWTKLHKGEVISSVTEVMKNG